MENREIERMLRHIATDADIVWDGRRWTMKVVTSVAFPQMPKVVGWDVEDAVRNIAHGNSPVKRRVMKEVCLKLFENRLMPSVKHGIVMVEEAMEARSSPEPDDEDSADAKSDLEMWAKICGEFGLEFKHD